MEGGRDGEREKEGGGGKGKERGKEKRVEIEFCRFYHTSNLLKSNRQLVHIPPLPCHKPPLTLTLLSMARCTHN